jgi:Zn ribbon nucleic-acid-binding protein
MITIGIEDFVTGFLVSGLVFFAVVWLYYDRRDRLFYDRQRLRHVHHCVKCGHLYTSAEAGVAECPSCGFENASLRF